MRIVGVRSRGLALVGDGGLGGSARCDAEREVDEGADGYRPGAADLQGARMDAVMVWTWVWSVLRVVAPVLVLSYLIGHA